MSDKRYETDRGQRANAVFVGACLCVSALVLGVVEARAQHQHGNPSSTPPSTQAPTPAAPGEDAASRKVTMEELHRLGGVPLGWKFALPAGDAGRGRQVFGDLECYKCHAIQGEKFPQPGGDAKNVGPELTGMGSHHPAEYFAESILSPNAVILEGPGYTGLDGKSIMPSYADSLSVTQLVDLVAFLKSLTAGGHDHRPMSMEKTAGDYIVRLEYAGGGHGDHAGHAAAAGLPGHLMVFVKDRLTGEPVPYLPLTASIRAAGKPAQTAKLSPMVGGRGFHYGVNVTVPESPHTITLTIGPATMQVMATARGRYAKAVTVVFERAPGG